MITIIISSSSSRSSISSRRNGPGDADGGGLEGAKGAPRTGDHK